MRLFENITFPTVDVAVPGFGRMQAEVRGYAIVNVRTVGEWYFVDLPVQASVIFTGCGPLVKGGHEALTWLPLDREVVGIGCEIPKGHADAFMGAMLHSYIVPAVCRALHDAEPAFIEAETLKMEGRLARERARKAAWEADRAAIDPLFLEVVAEMVGGPETREPDGQQARTIGL